MKNVRKHFKFIKPFRKHNFKKNKVFQYEETIGEEFFKLTVEKQEEFQVWVEVNVKEFFFQHDYVNRKRKRKTINASFGFTILVSGDILDKNAYEYMCVLYRQVKGRQLQSSILPFLGFKP